MRRPSKAEMQKVTALSEAQAAHEAAGLPSRTGPLFRAVALDTLAELERKFTAGDEWAVVIALNQCAVHDLEMPDWLAREWLKRSRAAMFYEVASWDDVLPPIKPKGRKLSALRDARRWTLAVVQAVHAVAGPQVLPERRAAIDEQLFDALADRHGWPFSGAKAKNLYYAARKSSGPYIAHYFAAPAVPARRRAPSTIRRRS